MATLKPEVEAIRKSKIYEAVAKRIERLIAEKLRPGEKLPPERRLAEIFRVSRSSIRDAIRSLELAGLVEPRQGAGTVAELLDVRKIIEPPLAARAAENVSADELAEMADILRRQEERFRHGDLAIDEDAEFHASIAFAANNSVVLNVLDVLMDLLRDTRERSLQVNGRLQRSLAGHKRILAALKRGDAAAAEAAMRHHLDEIEFVVLEKL